MIEGVTGSETQSEPQTTPSGAPDDTFVPKRFYILEMRPVISSNDFKMMFKVYIAIMLLSGAFFILILNSKFDP